MKFKALFLINAFLILILFSKNLNAQLPPLRWAHSGGGSDMDLVSSIAIDDSGNVYATGYFRDTVDFDPGNGIMNLISAGNEDIFISKTNKSGDIVWAKEIGGNDFDWAYSIKLDKAGNIFITGFFSSTVDFNPDSGTHNITSAGLNDIFISKFNNSGEEIWTSTMGGTNGESGLSLAIDDTDNVYTTGTFSGITDFDPDSSSTYNLTSNGELEIYVSKLDSNGNFVWAKSIGGTEDDEGYSIALDDDGNIYTTGYFEKTADFNPGADTFNLTSGNLPDAFISKLNNAGNFIWAKSFTGIPDNDGYWIDVDHAGNIYSTGAFNGTIDFDPDTNITNNITSAGGYDAYINKLDSAGNVIWTKIISGTDDDQSFYLSLDDSANIYSSGIFRSTTDFDPDDTSTFNLTSAGGFDAYILKLDSAGNFLWAKRIGDSNRDQVNVILPDTAGNIFIGGYFYSADLNIDSIRLTNYDPSTLTSDFFIARFGTDDIMTAVNSLRINSTDLNIYPNPANDKIYIKLNSSMARFGEMNITDFRGREVYSGNLKSGIINEIEMGNMPSGIYLIHIYGSDISEVRRIILEKKPY